MLQFTNAVATLKEGASINEANFRDTKVFARLLLPKGSKLEDIQSVDSFQLSESREYIRAELFWLNKKNVVITDNRLFVNVNKNSVIKYNEANKFYYVELIHPSIALSKDEVVFGK